MPLADFVHLRVHTAYSLSAGAIKVKELVQRVEYLLHSSNVVSPSA